MLFLPFRQSSGSERSSPYPGRPHPILYRDEMHDCHALTAAGGKRYAENPDW